LKADLIFYNAEVVTMEGYGPVGVGPVRDSVAVKDGRIVFPERGGSWRDLLGRRTEAVDLKGASVIPGLVDCHLHPLWGARALAGPSLDYLPLDAEGTLERLRAILEADVAAGPDDLLIVRNWQRHGGADMTAADLDRLGTRRPVLLFSGDCHTAALNGRAMAIYRDFFDGLQPLDGRILLGPSGCPNGMVEDGQAMRLYDAACRRSLLATAGELRRGLAALNSQGVTSAMDARATEETLDAAILLWEQDDLTVRLSGAWELDPGGCPSPEDAPGAVEAALAVMARHARGPDGPDPGAGSSPDAHVRPGIGLRHLKLFVDGMPGHGTARLRRPYLAVPGPDGGTAPPPPGNGLGVAYFDAPVLEALFLAADERGLWPHCHVIADGALDLVLQAASALRRLRPGSGARPAAAHLDLVSEDQYGRMRELGVAAVLSFQWAGLTGEQADEALAMFGQERVGGLETCGRFLDYGVAVAYGSDWPVNVLDEWRNFQAGALRRCPDGAGEAFPRLGSDRDLTVPEILSAATRGSAWILGVEETCGRLAEGRPADLAVLDGPVLFRDPSVLKDTRVMRTVVGGKTVWRGE
jgi:predicted amidohydrolase YtcJ